MKIILTIKDSCRQIFLKDDGMKFLFPGQDFRPVNDQFENMKCADVYVGPVIDDDLECNPGCPAEGSNVTITVTNSSTSLPVAGAKLDLRLDGVAILIGTSDASGVIHFNVPYGYYAYTLNAIGFEEKIGTLTVDNCIDMSIEMTVVTVIPPLEPFNIHGFLTVHNSGSGPGSYSLAGFFGVPLAPVIPPGNAYRTKWCLRSDACGSQLTYFLGDLDDNGHLLTTGINYGGLPAYAGFDPVTMNFISNYNYPEGMYLQLGVIIDDVLTFLPASPCIAGGQGTP